jgi:crossover junction endodeoxyribonuclease RuvC
VLFIGIDPGCSGGVAVLDEFGKHDRTFKLDGTDADVAGFLLSVAESGDCFAMVEKVHAMPKQGVTSVFTFGRSLGFIHGLLTAYRVPFEEVSPQRWQKFMECRTKGDKNVSKAKAQQLWPSVKITHANADALLIAEYGRRTRK